MKKNYKKNIEKTLERVKKSLENKEDIVICTKDSQILVGNPVGIDALLLGAMGTIKNSNTFGKVIFKAALRALEDEDEELDEDDVTSTFTDAMDMIHDAINRL